MQYARRLNAAGGLNLRHIRTANLSLSLPVALDSQGWRVTRRGRCYIILALSYLQSV
jgi:hypothetical protein